jgi:D-alanyl-lipoteichoic acid acyltransferase DltB (MBOAT superfamily)
LGSLSAQQPFDERVLSTILVAASYPLYLYSNFSGYIDVVIGIARFLRMRLPENFNRPFSSDNFLNFWSRWHITLSEWLKTYVHNPLLLNLMRRYPAPGLQAFWGVLAIS